MKRILTLISAMALLWAGCTSPGHPAGSTTLTQPLSVAESWTLTPQSARFDASALVRLPDGRLLTVNDKETGLFEIRFPRSGTEAELVPYASLSPALFGPLTPGRDLPWDVEGIGIDSSGALYLCEEHLRWILRQPAPGKPLERLSIDWSPASHWFSKTDRNASFEGVAVGDRFLYVANERDTGRILEIDRKTLRVTGDFQPRPPGAAGDDIHYTDLCWFDGELWALCREHRRVLCIDPKTHAVRLCFSYFPIEMDPRYAYQHLLPYGFFEGLSVDADNVWLLVDNNGYPRKSNPQDARPLLLRCPRPDRAKR
ncbi:MAG: esterase-like activity of phytase family protein [Verrucomicrobium sp.]|nr:esterase-like activity of phytase family protein [Verrucomicrobium sp.]